MFAVLIPFEPRATFFTGKVLHEVLNNSKFHRKQTTKYKVMTKQSTVTRIANTETKTNLTRLHRVLDRGDTIIKVDYADLYVGCWYEDEDREECLTLETESGGVKTFSKDAIEQGTIDRDSITMTADDGQEYLLAFFSTKAARL
jgi:hypothetical protein